MPGAFDRSFRGNAPPPPPDSWDFPRYGAGAGARGEEAPARPHQVSLILSLSLTVRWPAVQGRGQVPA